MVRAIMHRPSVHGKPLTRVKRFPLSQGAAERVRRCPWKANDPSKALSIVSHGQGEHVSPLRPWKANEVSEALCIVSWSGGTRPPMSIAKTMAGFSLD
jgi:hypothetical protein